MSRRNVESQTVACVAKRRSPWRGRGRVEERQLAVARRGASGASRASSVGRRASGGKGAAAEESGRNAPVEGPLAVDTKDMDGTRSTCMATCFRELRPTDLAVAPQRHAATNQTLDCRRSLALRTGPSGRPSRPSYAPVVRARCSRLACLCLMKQSNNAIEATPSKRHR
jgi:hypothetical protein